MAKHWFFQYPRSCCTQAQISLLKYSQKHPKERFSIHLSGSFFLFSKTYIWIHINIIFAYHLTYHIYILISCFWQLFLNCRSFLRVLIWLWHWEKWKMCLCSHQTFFKFGVVVVFCIFSVTALSQSSFCTITCKMKSLIILRFNRCFMSYDILSRLL